MERTELALHLGRDRFGSARLGEIEREHERLLRPQFPCQSLETVAAAGDEREADARLTGEPARRRLADAAGGTGDQRDIGHPGIVSERGR